MAEDCRQAEAELKENMSGRRREILEGKRLKLLEVLLAEAGHKDTQLVNDLANGFDLTGSLPEAHVFNKRFRPATIPCDDLRRVADSGYDKVGEQFWGQRA
jgi:hypothetical protein